jgi:REP element-mobilizing transposase RayT
MPQQWPGGSSTTPCRFIPTLRRPVLREKICPGALKSVQRLCENESHGANAQRLFRSSRPPCRRSSMTADDTTLYRGRLPHWRVSGAIYFVTWRVAKGQSELSPDERDLVVAALRNFGGQRYRLIGYVVMNDHVHVVVEPSTGHNLTKIVQSWKSYTTNRMQRSCGRKGRVWRGSISTALFGTTRNSATGLPGVALLIRGRLSLPRSAPSRGDWRSDTEHQSSTAFQAWKARHTAFTKVA